jgi:hypothetical protein
VNSTLSRLQSRVLDSRSVYPDSRINGFNHGEFGMDTGAEGIDNGALLVIILQRHKLPLEQLSLVAGIHHGVFLLSHVRQQIGSGLLCLSYRSR